MPERLALAVCPQYAAEARHACAALGALADGVEVVSFERSCERANTTWETLRASLDSSAASCTRVCWLGAGCLPADDPLPGDDREFVERRPLCFEFVTNRALIEREVAAGSHLVTPGWLRHWRTHVAAMGYDESVAREHFAEFAERVLLLDTALDRDAPRQLDDFAAFVGRPAATLPVGTDVFVAHLRALVLGWRVRSEETLAEASRDQLVARLADASMVLDLVGQLAAPGSEPAVVERIVQLMALFLPPEHALTVATLGREGISVEVRTPPEHTSAAEALEGLGTLDPRTPFVLHESGFTVPVRYRDQALGVIHVSGIASAALAARYANVTTVIAPVCGLAITYARTLSGVLPICSGCKRIRDTNGAWREVEVYVRDHSTARFSHGLCPDCTKRMYPDFS